MAIVRIDAVSDPFTLEDADLVSSAMDALLFMESMGLLSADVDRLDRETLLDIAETAARAGIAQTDAARLMSEKDLEPATIRAFLERLGDSLRESPMPELELASLLDLFPHDELGTLLGASESSLRRYASGARRPRTPSRHEPTSYRSSSGTSAVPTTTSASVGGSNAGGRCSKVGRPRSSCVASGRLTPRGRNVCGIWLER